jgi:hypothetical protein
MARAREAEKAILGAVAMVEAGALDPDRARAMFAGYRVAATYLELGRRWRKPRSWSPRSRRSGRPSRSSVRSSPASLRRGIAEVRALAERTAALTSFAGAAAVTDDRVEFAASLGIAPDPWQRDLLRSDAARVLMNCCRQSGKSTLAAILALHLALTAP